MKRFIVKIFLVLGPFFIGLSILIRVAYTSELQVLKQELTFPTNILGVVVGDSRVETSFDPDEIPWIKNLGLSGMPFTISAQEARLVAALNPDIQLLIIDVWPTRFFSTTVEPFAIAEPKASPGIALIELMTREDMPPFGDGFEVRLFKGVMEPWLERVLFGHNRGGQIVGDFRRLNKFLKNGITFEYEYGRPGGVPLTPFRLPETPAGGEIVLEHLLEYLSAKNINVVLTTTPMLWYEHWYSAEARLYFERRMSEISEAYNTKWYNWINKYQTETNYWADCCHLNMIGAKAFSHEIRGVLERHLRKPSMGETYGSSE